MSNINEYKNMLKKLNVKDLKHFISVYMSHVKIKVSGKKKQELIEHILTHTDLINGKIKIKDSVFDIPVNTKDIKKLDIFSDEFGNINLKKHQKEMDDHKKLVKEKYKENILKIKNNLKNFKDIKSKERRELIEQALNSQIDIKQYDYAYKWKQRYFDKKK